MTTEAITRYVRYALGDETSWGILEGDTIRQLDGYLFDNPTPTGRSVSLADVKLLLPLDASRVSKVIGVAAAYDLPGHKRVVPHPHWFSKLPTALNAHDADVELPEEATNFNFEGELVLIIGRQGRHIPVEAAADYVFGVTVGNDWSENTWFWEQQGIQEPSRFIAKSCDTWACLGTTIVRGLDYYDLGIEIRLNGELVAKGRTTEMTNTPARLVAYVSRFVTLMPGDVIYTGTVAPTSFPGVRREMQPGDVVEVEIEQVGLLRNRVVPMKPWPEGVMPLSEAKA